MEMDVKIVYQENDEIRAVRGDLQEDDDPDFFLLYRNGGSWIRLNKAFVIKIEKPGRGGD